MRAIAFALFLPVLGAQEEFKQVRITDRGYVPDRLEVYVGQKVHWLNDTYREHSVVARRTREGVPLFESGTMGAGTTWDYTFVAEGTYSYYCGVENHLTGVVIVRQRP